MPDPAPADPAIPGATAPAEVAPAEVASAEVAPADTAPADATPRQRVVRSAGARRARLTPAPDTDPNPEPAAREEGGQTSGDGSSTSANDARLRQDKPPHW